MAKDKHKGKKKQDKDETGPVQPSTASSSLVVAALPSTRAELLVLHAEARRRRNAVAPDTNAYREAAAEIARIEVQVARIERAMDPPLG